MQFQIRVALAVLRIRWPEATRKSHRTHGGDATHTTPTLNPPPSSSSSTSLSPTLRRGTPPRACLPQTTEKHRRTASVSSSISSCSPLPTMLAKLPSLPFLAAPTETAALGFFPSCDLLSLPSVVCSKKKRGRRLNIMRSTQFVKSQNASNLHKKWRTLSADPAQAAAMDACESKTWEDCKLILTSLNFSIEEAEKMLKKAFGWIHSPYWTEERKKEVPNVEVVSGVLDYIRGLGLSDDDLYKLLKKFPEVLGCNLESEVKLNVGKLDSDWGINGKTLRNVLLRNPKVLGYNVDCGGDCVAQCTRCWVRF